MNKNLKKPTTFQQQVELLSQKNVLISDRYSCESFLSKTNYYRLSGYLLPFIDKSEEYCVNAVNFETIRGIYDFDAELRNIISLSIEKIEIYIRTQLAYYSAHHYGGDGYLDPSNFNAKHNHFNFSKRINICISENAKSPVVKHHMEYYGGKFPIWVIIDFFSLGMLSYFYTGMKNPDKASIAKQLYSVNYQTLSSWLRCLTDLRNRCAHYSRLYYWTFPAIPKMPKRINFNTDRTLFSQLFMLKMMYPYLETWDDDFLKPLASLMKQYKSCLSREHIGFPYRWKSLLSRR